MTGKLSDSQLSALSDFVAVNMGLFFPRSRWQDMERHMQSAATEFGFTDVELFFTWLLASPLTREQVEILASHLTIAETYFWREPAVFEALRDHVLPTLIQKRGAESRRLRIWCAGCATGEEPYSIAILLRSLIPDVTRWHITILATDINPNILRKAAAGIYREWSFRNSPPGFKEQNFTATEDGLVKILPEIRSMVTFAYLNLAEDIFPSSTTNTNAMDLIFCRNVLMYFSTDLTKQVTQRLYQCLVEGGWFVVSSSELSQVTFSQFSAQRFLGAILYRREAKPLKPPNASAAPTRSNRPMLPTPPPKIAKLPPPHRPPPGQGNVPPAHEVADTVPATPPELDKGLPEAIQAVRELANLGMLDAAWAVCEAAIRDDKLNLGLYYLGATILQEQDRDPEAAIFLQHAIYLDSGFVLGHFALGNLAQRRGDRVTARKYFANVLALLERLDPDDLLPEAEGLTTGRLREITRATLQTGILL